MLIKIYSYSLYYRKLSSSSPQGYLTATYGSSNCVGLDLSSKKRQLLFKFEFSQI